jgi:hypothetical protein
LIETLLWISCKIKEDSGHEYKCVICGLWNKVLFKHDLFSLKRIVEDCGCFETKPKGSFILSPKIEVVSFLTSKKNNEI